jgi:hypothetical protein
VDKFFSRNQGIASWDVQNSQGFLFFHNPQGLLQTLRLGTWM